MLKQETLVYAPIPTMLANEAVYYNKVGQTYFEINNYLGNVNAVITDRKSANLTPSASNASTWEAVVVNTSDYYPFGMQMPGRSNSYGAGVEYRYAYNGMELDNEVSGTGNSYTTEFRQYDPRLGRWKSLDPLMQMFPSLSPYCGFDNNPILYTDPFGLSAEGEPQKRQGSYSENRREIENGLGQAPRKNGEEQEYHFTDGKYKKVKYISENGRWKVKEYENTDDENSMASRYLQHHDRGTTLKTPRTEEGQAGSKIGKLPTRPVTPLEVNMEIKVVKLDPYKPSKPVVKLPKGPGGGTVSTPGTTNSPPNGPPKPPAPCLTGLDALFEGSQHFFKTVGQDPFMKSLKPVMDYMRDNPSEKYTIHIYTGYSKNGTVPSIPFFLDSPYEGGKTTTLTYGRFKNLLKIIKAYYPDVNIHNFMYKDHYNETPKVEFKSKNCN